MGTGELYAAQQAEERRRQAVRDSQRYKDDIGHDKDKNLAGIQKVISVNNITISRADIEAEQARLSAFGLQYGLAFKKIGTWSERLNKQQQAIRAREAQQHDLRYIGLRAAKINPINIERWANEDKLAEEEEERLLKIELEKERIQAENQRIENQRLMEIENKKIQYEIIEEEKRIRRINELQEIENQKIQDEIIPAVVATSSLIPLAVIGLLLYSRKRKK
jgi:hypothetical protein